MPFIALCEDHPDTSQKLRQQYLAAHLEYIESIHDQVLVAGPLAPDNGDYNGSLFIYRAETRAGALQLLENDPYYKAGLYLRTTLCLFKPAAGHWIGGPSWPTKGGQK